MPKKKDSVEEYKDKTAKKRRRSGVNPNESVSRSIRMTPDTLDTFVRLYEIAHAKGGITQGQLMTLLCGGYFETHINEIFENEADTFNQFFYSAKMLISTYGETLLKMEKCKSKIQEQERDIKDLKEAYNKTLKEKDSKIIQLKGEIEHYENYISELDEETSRSRVDSKTLEEKNTESLTNQLTELSNQYKITIDKVTVEHTEREKEMENTINRLKKELNEQGERYNTLMDENIRFRNQLNLQTT